MIVSLPDSSDNKREQIQQCLGDEMEPLQEKLKSLQELSLCLPKELLKLDIDKIYTR